MAAARIRASEAAKKITHLLVSPFAAKSMVASWVLSPISARKTVVRTVKKVRHMDGAYRSDRTGQPERLSYVTWGKRRTASQAVPRQEEGYSAAVQRIVPLLLMATSERVAVPPSVAAGTITTA